MAKAKSAYGYSRRGGMTDEILREASGSTLTMSMIGCLPDNVQQAIKSFSIRPGKQHVTFCFPFMGDIVRRFMPDTFMADLTLSPQHNLTPGLFFDQSIEVISGYQSFITLAPTLDRSTMPVVLFTLYQRDSTEGILQHFDSLIKILLDNKTLLTVWKMPLAVVDLSPQTLDQVVDTCAQAILDIQNENLLNTFPEKSKDDLLQFIKDKMIVPNVRTYGEHFECHVKEVSAKIRSIEPERFLAVVDHLRTVTCSAVDFQKADMMMKSPTTDPLIKSFWRIWGQDQLASKVFPMAMAGRTVGKIGPFMYPLRPTPLDPSLVGLAHVPIKEGLQSIIKCLKAQDINNISPTEKNEKLKGCNCSVCRSSLSPRFVDPRQKLGNYWETHSSVDIFRSQSAFYRPTPASKLRFHHTTTPYSDALKAAAVLPLRPPTLSASESPSFSLSSDPLATLRTDFRASPLIGPIPPPPYWLTSLPLPPYKITGVETSAVPPMYPIIYKPKIITQESSPKPSLITPSDSNSGRSSA